MAQTKTGWFRRAVAVLKRAAARYGPNAAGRMAAAVSFRTVFAIAPVLVIAVSIAGMVLGGNKEAVDALVANVAEVAGPQLASFLEDLIRGALESADAAAVIGVVVLLWSSSTLFLELQRDLNQIFEVAIKKERRFLVMLAQRGVGVLWTVGIGLALVALFALNAATQIAGESIASWLGIDRGFVVALGFLVSFGFMALMFGLVFQTLTMERIPWRPVWVGALFTAVSFSLAAYLTGFYFSRFGAPTALGFTGSIVVLLFLTYLLSSVFLFGAAVTQSYRELVYEADRNHLIFNEPIGPPAPPSRLTVTMTSVVAFVVGLILGRRR